MGFVNATGRAHRRRRRSLLLQRPRPRQSLGLGSGSLLRGRGVSAREGWSASAMLTRRSRAHSARQPRRAGLTSPPHKTRPRLPTQGHHGPGPGRPSPGWGAGGRTSSLRWKWHSGRGVLPQAVRHAHMPDEVPVVCSDPGGRGRGRRNPPPEQGVPRPPVDCVGCPRLRTRCCLEAHAARCMMDTLVDE